MPLGLPRIDPKFARIMAVYMGETMINHVILLRTRMTHDVVNASKVHLQRSVLAEILC